MSKGDVQGFDELMKNLQGLSKPRARTAMRRAFQKSGEPLVQRARSNAPHITGGLRDSINMGTKLTAAQARKHRKAPHGAFEAFVGSVSPLAHLVEFGTEHSGPRPFLAPAWDATKDQILASLKDDLAAAISDGLVKQSKAAARKAARKAAK